MTQSAAPGETPSTAASEPWWETDEAKRAEQEWNDTSTYLVTWRVHDSFEASMINRLARYDLASTIDRILRAGHTLISVTIDGTEGTAKAATEAGKAES